MRPYEKNKKHLRKNTAIQSPDNLFFDILIFTKTGVFEININHHFRRKSLTIEDKANKWHNKA